MGTLSRINARQKQVLRRVQLLDGEERPRSVKRFSLYFEGFLFGQQGARKSFAEVRRDAAVLGKLHAISVEKPDGSKLQTGDADRVLSEGAHTLLLTGAELLLLQERIEVTNWRTGVSIDVVDAVDFLIAAPEAVDDSQSVTGDSADV